ncbi:MAG: single-stranded DNA-binding protein [[Eubacterium] saphenum]|nr:single-stranded DNA-binding protein [[Eubacterium] saphenum]
MAYNRVILMGRLTRDPELKTTASGVNVCSFSIAVDRRFQAKGEEKKADFFNIVAWRQQGEFVSRYFKKGNMILVEGELQTRQYTNKDGQNVNVTEIIADQITFTGSKSESGSGSYSQSGDPGYGTPPPVNNSYSASSAPSENNSPAADFSSADSDDYPF